jgi:hypothetical protein
MIIAKSLFPAILLLLSCGWAKAMNDVVFMDGYPGWRIANGNCTFEVPGRIVNQSPQGSISGTLRLCLWVTSKPIQGQFTGYRIATYKLGQLRGGYQYSNIRPTTKVTMPKLTGSYYFTVVVEQYNGSGYTISDTGNGTVKYLKNGAFTSPPKWNPPSGAVIAPKKTLKVGENLNLTLKGSQSDGSIIYVPIDSQLKLRVKIEANGETTVYGGSKPEGAPALYTYSVKNDRYKSRSFKVGSIRLDYGAFFGVESYSKYSLFFQKPNKGFYKGVDVDQGFSGTSWGIFSIN